MLASFNRHRRMKAENMQIPQKLATRLKFAYCAIWIVMSQRVIEWIRNLCLNVFCVGWHLAVSHKYNLNSLVAILHINKVMRPAIAKGCTPLLYAHTYLFFQQLSSILCFVVVC